MKTTLKKDKGTAGLTILLSLVVMLFVIGLLIMIFTIMGSKLQESNFTELTNVSVINESVTFTSLNAVQTLSVSGLPDVSCGGLTYVANGTNVGAMVLVANFTRSGCTLINATAIFPISPSNTYWNASYIQFVSYTYTYSSPNTATTIINDTTQAIAGTTDWFDIFIVIGAMVVLILLTVIIITAIRSSGMVQGAGSTSNPNKVGTA